MHPYTPSATWHPTVDLIDDSDAPTASNFNSAPQAIADNTEYLYANIGARHLTSINYAYGQGPFGTLTHGGTIVRTVSLVGPAGTAAINDFVECDLNFGADVQITTGPIALEYRLEWSTNAGATWHDFDFPSTTTLGELWLPAGGADYNIPIQTKGIVLLTAAGTLSTRIILSLTSSGASDMVTFGRWSAVVKTWRTPS